MLVIISSAKSNEYEGNYFFVFHVCLLLSILETSNGFPCRAFEDEDRDDDGLLRPILRIDVKGDLFFIIYSCAYNNTPMSLKPASREIFNAVLPSWEWKMGVLGFILLK